jgi:hypothetical protein
MSDFKEFDEFVTRVAKGTKDLAENTLRGYKEEALVDTKIFLEKSKDDAKRWSKLLVEGSITKDDYEWLILSRKDVVELTLLKQAGLSAVRIDRFKNALINLVIDTAFDVFV